MGTNLFVPTLTAGFFQGGKPMDTHETIGKWIHWVRLSMGPKSHFSDVFEAIAGNWSSPNQKLIN